MKHDLPYCITFPVTARTPDLGTAVSTEVSLALNVSGERVMSEAARLDLICRLGARLQRAMEDELQAVLDPHYPAQATAG